jgi:hypothetical protein
MEDKNTLNLNIHPDGLSIIYGDILSDTSNNTSTLISSSDSTNVGLIELRVFVYPVTDKNNRKVSMDTFKSDNAFKDSSKKRISTGNKSVNNLGATVDGTKNATFSIDSDGTAVLLKNSSGELHVRNAGDTADAKIKTKALQLTTSEAFSAELQTVGALTYNNDNDGTHTLNTSGLNITPLYSGVDLISSTAIVTSNIGADARLAFKEGALAKWVMGHDANKTTTFTQANCVKNGTTTITYPDGETFDAQGSLGALVTGTGIPDNTYVSTMNKAGNSFTISNTAGDSLTSTLTFTIEDDKFKINSGGSLPDDSLFSLDNDGKTTFKADDFGANAALKLTASQPATAEAEDSTGLHIDYDRTVAGSGTAAHNDVGIDLDMNTASLGTSKTTGLDIDIVGAASGTHSAIGLDINVSGAGQNNKGMILRTTGTGARQFTFEYDDDNYAQVFVNDSGVLSMTAVGDPSSQIIMEAGSFSTSTNTAELAGNLHVSTTGSSSTRTSVVRLLGNAGYGGSGWRHFYIATLQDSSTKIYNDADNTTTHAADIEIEATKDIILDAASDVIIDPASGITHFRDAGDTDDEFKITVVGGTGATTLETVSDGADGHLSVVADGHVEFDGCGVGFDLVTPAYDATDTEVSFLTGNKQFVTFGSGNITNLKLTFPATSGNFTVLLKQDGSGSRTITNYKVYESDGSAATVAAAKFPGGSNPTLTTAANHVDILSFFWDADNQVAYGVATLDFQD